jgi:hypothetical protein
MPIDLIDESVEILLVEELVNNYLLIYKGYYLQQNHTFTFNMNIIFLNKI